ncbi:hypothetical protein WDW37_04015 [Bdellovibrionota bacterium FG-1]
MSSARAILGDQLGLSPFWHWQTLESEHFRVTFPAELSPVAQRMAGHLEQAHSILAPRLHWQPWHKTQILVIDNADLANGLTTAVARLGIVLYVTPPDSWFSTAYYDDWLRLLAIHEYTHFLNMDATDDFYIPLRYLVGDVLLPNSAWPSWMLEGLAVYMETRFTHAGRGRSPLYEMILRTAVEANQLDSPQFMTLDRLNGGNPWNPAGETPYLFGYQLMNQIEQEHEDALGSLSIRSAGRIPFFINGNLENITGKDWPQYWKEWVEQTQKRMTTQLEQIRAQPVTPVEIISPDTSLEGLGATPSPDGKWLAYTNDSADRRSGLYLMDLTHTAERPKRIADKFFGATAAFTPDSKNLIYSSIHRSDTYYLWSDLAVYDLNQDSTYWLSDHLRARDPDVSHDGQWVTFTLTEVLTTSLALAPLQRDKNGRLQLGAPQRLATTQPYDRVSSPRFSRDGRTIYYSLHQNGQASEELMSWNISENRATVLVSNGKFNRNPAVSPQGEVYFVSDLNGVDNLYRLVPSAPPQVVTNVTTGLAFPIFGPTLYATYYTWQGWKIGRISLDPKESRVSSSAPLIQSPPMPVLDSLSDDMIPSTSYPVHDYSLFPSLLPRQWLIAPLFFPGGIFVLGEIAGFDATDRHSYIAGLGYNSNLHRWDWQTTYSNRSWGPTLSLNASQRTSNFETNDSEITQYTRRDSASAALSFPFRWTYSSLTPVFGLSAERSYDFLSPETTTPDVLVSQSRYVPIADFSLFYSAAEFSRLAISPEHGRNSAAGIRLYEDSGRAIWKGSLKDEEYFEILPHTVLIPSAKALWTSSFDSNYGPANSVVQGRTAGLSSVFPNSTFDEIGLRGYPFQIFYSQAVAVGSLDLRFPLSWIYRGWSTHPFFAKNLYGFTFAEAAYFPTSRLDIPVLPSAGVGIRLNTEVLLRVPLIFSLEYHQGFRTSLGGKSDFFATVNLGQIQL